MTSPATAHGDQVAGIDSARINPASGKKVFGAGIALAVIGIAMAGAAFASDPKRFGFSYLTGFMFVTTLSLGGLFFVILQHLTRAGWSVAARRTQEWLAGLLPFCAILFIPIALNAHLIFAEWWGSAVLEDEILKKKAVWLNPTFFFIRAAIYFAVWTGLTLFYRSNSLKQDQTGDKALTLKMQKWAPPSMFLFAFSLTFAGFDWLMSLNPHWYSTIFGVYIFAGANTAAFSFLALVTIFLQRADLFKRVSTVEHRHDIGKLLFGFTVFWAYIAFSQFFLIWYANIPEETIFYRDRWVEGWKTLSLVLLFGHFWIPFFGLISRTAKRSFFLLGLFAACHLVIHYVDMYWLVMPNLDEEGMHFTWIDVAGFLAPVGVLAAWIGYRLSKDPIYPLKDPRLVETMKLENL